MLSLSPRFDLFRFALPKDFLPKHVEDKWLGYLNKEPGVIVRPIEYLNESIVGVSFPGIQDINIEQHQISFNKINRMEKRVDGSLGRINIEPAHPNITVGPYSPINRIENDFKVNFRMNQGLYNYFMLYETILWRINKPELYDAPDRFFVKILNEEGTVCTSIMLDQCHIDGIEGLEFGFDKTQREVNTFTCTFKFNNIDLDINEDLEEVPLR